MNNQRTPQQASIEAREAREAWERGEPIQVREASYSDAKWLDCDSIGPAFTSVSWQFRPKPKPTPPVITPGKWRTRGGVLVDIVAAPGARWPWRCDRGMLGVMEWNMRGEFHPDREHDLDLLTRVETKWRPFKPEEVELGMRLRRKSKPSHRASVEDIDDDGIVAGISPISFREALDGWELLLPDGTYAPCGIEEEIA